MMEILLFVVFIYVILSNRGLAVRVSDLEDKLKANNRSASYVPPPVVQNGVSLKDASQYSASNQQKLEQISESVPLSVNNNINLQFEDKPSKFVVWLKEDWLMKLGAILFIMGFGWFVSYAFANNWIGPVGRISIGIVVGSLIMAFGFRWMMKYVTQGALFMALGAGMVMLTIFAGRSIYGFFTPSIAVLCDFLVVSFISFASYKFNVKSLAFIAQILAFITPLLVAGESNAIFLFSYLFFVSLATLFLASITGWRELITSSLVFVGLYSMPYVGNGYSAIHQEDAPIILYFAYLFGALYLASGMMTVVRKGVQDFKNEIMLAVLNGLFLFVWIYNVAPKDWNAMIFALWAVIFVVSSFLVLKLSGALEPFYAYGSVAVAFIAAATAAQLHGSVLTIAFIIEIFLLVLNVLWLTSDVRAAMATAWLFIVPVVLSFSNIIQYADSRYVLTEDFFVLVLLAVTLIIVGRYIIHDSSQEKESTEVKSGGIFVVVGILYLVYIVWQVSHIYFRTTPDFATMIALVIFTLAGVFAYFAGVYGNDVARKTYGVALIALVVLRLILVDVWNMELFGRVITFLAIGVLLMSTAFITKKKKSESLTN